MKLVTLLTLLFVKSLFASKYEAYFNSMVIKYNSDTADIKINVLDDKNAVVINGVSTRGSYSINLRSNIWIGDTLFTPLMIIEKAQEQQEFIKNNSHYQLSELVSIINDQKILANKYLLLKVNLSKNSLIDQNIFNQIHEACKYSSYCLITLFRKTNFASIDELNAVLISVLESQWNDSILVKILKILNQKYPSMNLNQKYKIYNKIISDTYKVDAIKTFNINQIKSDIIAILKTIDSDTYKVDAIKVFSNLELSIKEVLSMINEISSDTYKVDAIKILSIQLKNISNEQYFTLLNSLSSSYKNDAMKYLPQQVTTTNQAICPNNQLINMLNSMSWDDSKIDVLKKFDLNNLSIQDTVNILKCFSWDDGKNSALGIILSKVSANSKANIKQNYKLIINKFSWDEGKNSAMMQIFNS